MNKNHNHAAFRLHGILKLEKVGDYLNLVDKKIRLVLKTYDPALKTRKINHADVVDLSATATHLVLREVHFKKYIFFSRHIKKYAVPLDNISSVQVLDKYGESF